MSEINIARSQVDLESLRLADLYRSHPLLQHFPVPRFRLPNVTLSVPVVVEELERAEPGGPPGGAVPIPEARKRFETLLRSRLEKSNLSISRQDWSNVRSRLDETELSLSTSSEVPPGPLFIADAFSDATIEALRVPRRTDVEEADPALAVFSEEIRVAARAEILSLQTPPLRLQVAVTTGEIREAGNPENLLRLDLSLSEEGMEWAIGEGETTGRLIPE